MLYSLARISKDTLVSTLLHCPLFQECVFSLGLADIPVKAVHFTYSNKQSDTWISVNFTKP